MSRMEFMQALERALSDVSSEEREAALQYYNDYLDDAGPEHEQEILAEWGTPWKLAESIRSGMDNRLDEGEFTESGFFAGEQRQCLARKGSPFHEEKKEAQPEKEPGKQSPNVWKWIAIALLCILLAPVCIPVVLSLVAVIVGIIVAALAVAVSLLIAGIAILLAGLLVAGVGIVKLFAAPAAAAVLIGGGLLLFVLGVLLSLLFGWIVLKSSVWLFRTVVSVCRKPFHKKEGCR